MNRRVKFFFVFSVLLMSMFGVTVGVYRVRASGTIYIRADGTIDPPTANLTSSDGVTYFFADNNYDSLVIERSNIILDGAGYTLQGSGSGDGLNWSGINNVTIRHTNIKDFDFGIVLTSSSNNSISGNTITASDYYSILLESSSNCNSISGNNITSNWDGIVLSTSSNNVISGNSITNTSARGVYLIRSLSNSVSGNNITNSYNSIMLYSSSRNNISGNSIANSHEGIVLTSSLNNSVSGNNIAKNGYGIRFDTFSNYNSISLNNITASNYCGIRLYSSMNSTFFHNNLIDNTDQLYSSNSVNVWDEGYPFGGNYWSNHAGIDVKSGPTQDQPGSDGVGDTPYTIDADNQDRYPLMKPWPWNLHDLGIANLGMSKPVVGQGYALHVNVTMFNYGNNTERFNVMVYTNTTVIHTLENITLRSRNSITLTFIWSTAGLARGNCAVSAYATPVLGEVDMADNIIDRWIFVTIAGDIDGDHDVDIYDITLMAGAYGTSQPDPKYDPRCDIDNDRDIDIYDIVIAAGNYGESW